MSICLFYVEGSIGIIDSMHLPANNSRQRNTARWTSLAFWFLDTQILHSTIHRSLNLDSYSDKARVLGHIILHLSSPRSSHDAILKLPKGPTNGRKPKHLRQSESVGNRQSHFSIPRASHEASWRCRKVRPTGQTITQRRSTLDSLNWFLCFPTGFSGKSFLIPNISPAFFSRLIWHLALTLRYPKILTQKPVWPRWWKRNKRVKVIAPANVFALWSLNLHYL